MAGLTCQTAPNTVFADMDELKAHYKSDWHRYNLKRKVVGLPMVSRELFERVVNHALSASEAAEQATPSTAHLKPDKPRRPARAHPAHMDEDEEDEEDDSDGDEWEEVEGDEAEAVIAQMAHRRGARQPLRARAGDSSGSEEDEEMAGAEQAGADGEGVAISLADNGVELVVGRHVLGAREFARYYKQRPRPVDSRALAVASAGGGSGSASKERGLVVSRSGRAPSHRGPAVTRQEARIQRVEQSAAARMRLMTEMSANGPQFRGYRE